MTSSDLEGSGPARRANEAFGLVLQKRGDKLVLRGTNAFGAKVFVVTQIGEAIETKSFVGPTLSVPPENFLRDIHRAYFLAPEQQAMSERTAEPVERGVRIESESCGCESLVLTASEQGGDGTPETSSHSPE